MKILLTGANGFIGSHLKHFSISHHYLPFSFENGNIDQIDFSNIDTIVHLAALVHQMGGASQKEYFNINTIRTIAFAKKAKQSGVKHFIFMSTIKVYGEENDTPYTEYSPCHPVDDYGKSKLEAEKGLEELEDDTFTISIIRTPIVYGPNVKGNIKNLIKLIQKITILPFDAIKNQRSMVYVGNLCTIINTLIEHPKSGIFLASDDQSNSTSQLIQTIANAMNKKILLLKIPGFPLLLHLLKPMLYQRLYGNLTVDNTLTKKTLTFQNPYSFEEGIKQTILGSKHA